MKLKQKKVLMLHMALMVFIAVASFAQSPTQTPGPTPGYVCPKPSMTIGVPRFASGSDRL